MELRAEVALAKRALASSLFPIFYRPAATERPILARPPRLAAKWALRIRDSFKIRLLSFMTDKEDEERRGRKRVALGGMRNEPPYFSVGKASELAEVSDDL